MKKLRIAIIGSRGYPYIYSGYETFVSGLAPRLVERGHDVTVYCHKGLFSSFPEYVNGVRLRYIPSVRSKTFSQLTNSFFSTLDALWRNYDILLFVNPANGPFGLLTGLMKINTAINIDGMEWLRPKWKGLGAKYFYFASKLATKFFDVVISDSEQMAEVYKKEFDAESVVIAYGEEPTTSQRPAMLEELHLSKSEYYLIVGRLIPDNNASLIIEGFKQSGTHRKLVIVGDVPYRDTYANRIKQTTDPRIIFTGYVRDAELLRELYCNTYVYIHGHEYGGTNPTLLKALASGCCVLALDTPFNREVLNGEQHGMYFQKNPADIVRCIDRIDHQESAVGAYRAKAQLRIQERYTWEHITDQYEELFDRMQRKSY
jgi:glycosyltransferase involved in cell wall biosynthesis